MNWLEAHDTPRILDAEDHATTIYSYKFSRCEPRGRALFSGIGPATLGHFTYELDREGHAIIENTARPHRPWNHRIIGVGIGHDDAEFAECGRSMAAYHESGEAWGGHWWDNPGQALKHFGLNPDGTRKQS